MRSNCYLKNFSPNKKAAENLLRRTYGNTYEISGLADEKKFTSSLSSYGKMCRTLKASYVNSHKDVVEKIIELQTVFEDKKTLKHQLQLLGELTATNCELLSNTHYTGWGKLSRKLLASKVAVCKIGNDFAPAKHSIIEIMRETNRNFMEIITDKNLGVGEWINQQNVGAEDGNSYQDIIDDLRVSPKVKRGINQAIRVIDDISKAVGKEPSRIFLELAGDVQQSARTVSRKSRLQGLYKSAGLQKEFQDLAESLNECSDNDLRDDRLFLYYTQLGKDMYTGEPLNLDRLSSDYDIDHIIPQAVTQNDSLDNRVSARNREPYEEFMAGAVGR